MIQALHWSLFRHEPRTNYYPETEIPNMHRRTYNRQELAGVVESARKGMPGAITRDQYLAFAHDRKTILIPRLTRSCTCDLPTPTLARVEELTGEVGFSTLISVLAREFKLAQPVTRPNSFGEFGNSWLFIGYQPTANMIEIRRTISDTSVQLNRAP